MQQFAQIVDQIEESKRLIFGGTLSQSRMALLLLDNAVELIAYRAIRNENITERKLDKIDRYFDEKLRFLKERHRITDPVFRALSATHRYRNEAYHSNEIRRETIRPVVLLLFELACDLLVTLLPGSYSTSGRDDWSEFERRFQVSVGEAFRVEGAKRIRDVLRKGLHLEVTELRELLADHLESRVTDILKALDFIGAGSNFDYFEEIKAEIIEHSDRYSDGSKGFKKKFTTFTVDRFAKMRIEIATLRQSTDKVRLFAGFADAEGIFEPMEFCLHELEGKIEWAIQIEAEIRRGK